MSPYKIKSMAGKSYRPSNGTEGMIFMDAFCDRCKRDAKYRETNDGEDGCPIAAASFWAEYDSPDYPKEWTHTAEGEPMCTAFEPEVEP